MNFEEAQRVAEKKRTSKKQQESLKREAVEKELNECKEFIKTRQIFKDLVSGNEEKFRKCIDYYFLTQLVPAINRNAMCNADYISGMRDGMEMFLAVANAYDNRMKKITELKGELK